ncbi:hypothetical protein D1BOALGB6SA_7100 [Olavius sp. associated proteobacterium Delta 1]|nr:hypothetical protein D1BOALGB6SA_7100 [Olavius sp. associated proteobacterium Delta 1]
MAFRKILKEIMVNDRAVTVPEQVKAGDLVLSAGKDPYKNDLVLSNLDGTVDLYPSNALIKVRDNAEFETQLSSRNGS